MADIIDTIRTRYAAGERDLRDLGAVAIPVHTDLRDLPGLTLGAYCKLGDDCTLGDDCKLGNHCKLGDVLLRDVASVPDLAMRIEAATAADGALKMDAWHCGTSHCRAGWAIHEAGDAGYALEAQVGPALAGALIYLASGEAIPDFFAPGDRRSLREHAAALSGPCAWGEE